MRRLLGAVIVMAAARDAGAELTMFGEGRAISRSGSASRDAPAFGTMLSPRTVMTAGAEVAIATLRTRVATFRSTFAGLLEIESDQRADEASLLFSPVGARFWRGAYAYSLLAATDAWLCAACVFEADLTARHETDHVTAGTEGPTNVRGVPIVGDELGVEVAFARTSHRWTIVGRVQHRFFIPDQSGYRNGDSVDVHLRWSGARSVHPFVSAFAESLRGATTNGQRIPDVHRVRGLVGIAVRGSLGDILVFLAADLGHRKGLAVLAEERTLGVGLRLSFGHLLEQSR